MINIDDYNYDYLVKKNLTKIKCIAVINENLTIIENGIIFVYNNCVYILNNTAGVIVRDDVANTIGYKYGIDLFQLNIPGEKICNLISNTEFIP